MDIISSYTPIHSDNIVIFIHTYALDWPFIFILNKTDVNSVQQSMPINELGLKPTNWKVVVMSKQDIVLLLWAKQWVLMLFLPLWRQETESQQKHEMVFGFPQSWLVYLQFPSSSFLPVQMVSFVSLNWVMLTVFRCLMLQTPSSLVPHQWKS